MRLTELIRAHADAVQAHPEHGELFRKLQTVAVDAVYEENECGAEARQVVADVARILGTDIDAGPGHRWDADHMQRVVSAAESLKSSFASSKAAHEAVWKLHQQRAGRIFGLQVEKADLRERAETAEQERDNYKRAYELKPAAMHLEGPGADKMLDAMFRETTVAYRANRERLEELARDVDDLKATIVSQAREIARLKRESA